MLRGTGITVRVEGRERLLTPEPKVFISNHTSFVDIWAILAEFPGMAALLGGSQGGCYHAPLVYCP